MDTTRPSLKPIFTEVALTDTTMPVGDGADVSISRTPAIPQATVPQDVPEGAALNHPSLYFNRELSWLDFNWRVLAQALDVRTPLLERVRFIAITANNLDEFYQKAYSLMTSKKAKEAFDIGQESDKMRSNYGITGVGQCCLLARRLVEAGCRFVAVENGHWDTHRKNTWSLREVLCPPFDQALPALLNDLSDRGLLESTLVVVMGEFGRTPRINKDAGRDHWPNVQSILLAGAGITGGSVFGASDRFAAEPSDSPVAPHDLAQTILHLLGVPGDLELSDAEGRPIRASRGTPIAGLYA